MIGPFLVAIAFFLFFVNYTGKSPAFLKAMFPGIESKVQSEEDQLDEAITGWAKTNIWTPIQTAISNGVKGIFGFTAGVNQPVSSGGSGNLVHGYTIDLAGGGQMTVNSTTMQGAIDNVIAQGGTPASG